MICLLLGPDVIVTSEGRISRNKAIDWLVKNKYMKMGDAVVIVPHLFQSQTDCILLARKILNK